MEDNEKAVLATEYQQWRQKADEVDSTKEKSREEEVENCPKLDVYLTWALDLNGNTTLRAISTARRHARHARGVLKDLVEQGKLIKVWTEVSITNHLIVSGDNLADSTLLPDELRS
jgi:hypothetical protein